MRFLVSCDHEQKILEASVPLEARAKFTCKKCVTFSLKASKWNYKNVRVYRAEAWDQQAAVAHGPVKEKPKKAVLDQMDWVELHL